VKVCIRCSHAHICAGTNQGFDRSCNRNCNFAFASAICLRLTSAIIAVLALLGLMPLQAFTSAVSGWICVYRICARICTYNVYKHLWLRHRYIEQNQTTIKKIIHL